MVLVGILNTDLLWRTKINLRYDKIVIGSSLEAVLFAFNNELPIFFTEREEPFRFDHFSPEIDLSYLKIEPVTRALSTFNGDKIVGVPKRVLWERLLFVLSLTTRIPVAHLCTSMRYDGQILTCTSEYSKLAEVKFDECYYFGDDNCTQLLTEKMVDSKQYICYDWVAFNSGGKHEIDLINTEDDFVKEIWYYSSDRIDGRTKVKDACAVSHLSEEDFANFDFSETMARFKVVHEMEERGMKGVFNGYCPKYGNPKYYKFKTSTIGRTKTKNYIQEYEEADNIIIPKVSLDELMDELSVSYVSYYNLIKHL